MISFKQAALVASLSLCVESVADIGRADDHTRIGAMADHRLAKGEWMFSYRVMTMDTARNTDGIDEVSLQEILRSGSGAYRVAPKSMTMHMFGAMRAPLDVLTPMAMVPYVSSNSMSHVTAMGERFKTDSNGIGDVG